MVIKRIILTLALFLLAGCAHQINITPPLNSFEQAGAAKSGKNVAYFISAEDLKKEVITPGGGGDKVKYLPYKETEPVLHKVLTATFANVYVLPAPNDTAFLEQNNISYVFIPKIVTNSSSGSMVTWPPTKFSVDLDCQATNATGETVWQKNFKGEGQATFDEFKHDFALSARRAVLQTFTEFRKEVSAEGKFK
jgi:hypothetical protein